MRGDVSWIDRIAGLGRQLREARLAAEMTQGDLAERAGVTQALVSAAERDGRPEIAVPTLCRLADALEADWGYDGEMIWFRRR